MLRGETEMLRIEEPGADKAEFVVTVGSRREQHQVKRSHPTGKWSLGALGSDGLLQAIGEQLAGNDDRFVFASASDARELAELCEAAEAGESTEEFERTFLAAEGRRGRFERVCRDWACNAPTAIERLRRIDVRTIGEPELERKVRPDYIQSSASGQGPAGSAGFQPASVDEPLTSTRARMPALPGNTRSGTTRGRKLSFVRNQEVRWAIPALFLADAGAVIEELRGIVEDSVHRTISRESLVEGLAQRGYRLRRLLRPENASVTLESATDRYLEGARSRFIRGKLIPTTAAGTLLSRLDVAATDNVVTGRAGSGKTACVVEVVQGLRARRMPVLAFRLDRVPFPSVSTTEALGRNLDLEESPVLALAAAADTARGPGILIVDQLDAVSTMSGRSSGAFDLVERLLQEARGMRPRTVIHTLVVCRAFDWQNDSRLRQIMPPNSHAPVEVVDFTVEAVKTVLVDGGFDGALFRERQLEILRLPQNLSLFLESNPNVSNAPAFRTVTELLDRYWTEKRRSVADRVAPASDQWVEVMETLCDEMTASQQLSVPKEKLDRIPTGYLDQAASEGVLTFDGRRYGFGHESFFDYCFARLFTGRPESLASFLKESEQHLFRRAQVRQVLAYLRDADFIRYVRELADLLSDGGIRLHIKELAFALLAEVMEPTDEEWFVWEKWTEPALRAVEEGVLNPDKLSALAWRRLFGALSWFEFADERGVVEGWLTSGNDRLADLAVSYLNVHHRHSPDRAAALLEPYADCSGQWPIRLRNFMQWCELHTSRRLFDLFLHLVDNGTLDEARGPIAVNSTFWSMLRNLGKNRPGWVPEVLAHRLRRRFVAVAADGESLGRRELLGYDYSAAEMFHESSKRAPALFVEHVLPIVLEISDSTLTNDEPPKRDAVWPVLLVDTRYSSGEQACLSALARALAALACDGSQDLREMLSSLKGRDTRVANHLLLNLYAGGGAGYAGEAVAAFCDEPWRFECGYSDSPHWCSREAISALIPHCTAENHERLEAVILDYTSPYERTSYGYRYRGRTQFALLSAIPDELRSPHANARFQELERKFGEPEGEPSGFTGGFVGPPIEEDAAEKMTDDQWLRAIAKYRAEDRMHFSSDGVTGGAWQLAQLLETRAKEEPGRFARLSLRFPADTNPLYLERTLAALKSARVASDLKLQVCRKGFEESCGRCGQAISDVIGSIEDPLPRDAVEMLHWLATEHDDPAKEAWQEDADGRQKYYRGDIHTNGINTTRGRAALAVWDLILHDAVYVEWFRPTLDRMVRDPSASVISCVAGTLRAVAYRDPSLALRLFLGMNLSEDRLLATRHVYGFVRDRLRDGFADLRSLLQRMLRSSHPEVCEVGGRLASLALLMDLGVCAVENAARKGWLSCGSIV